MSNPPIRKTIAFAIIGSLFYLSLPAIAAQSLKAIKEETARIQAENKALRAELRAKRLEQKKAKEEAEFEKYIQRLTRAKNQNQKLQAQLSQPAK